MTRLLLNKHNLCIFRDNHQTIETYVAKQFFPLIFQILKSIFNKPDRATMNQDCVSACIEFDAKQCGCQTAESQCTKTTLIRITPDEYFRHNKDGCNCNR